MKKNKHNLHAVFIGFSVLVLFCISFYCCNKETPVKPNPENGNGETFVPVAPAINPDSIYTWMEKQLSFGPRISNSSAHAACAFWLETKLKSYTPHLIVQQATITTYDKRNFNIKNFIASFNPENPRRMIICAHWDTRPFADQDKDEAKKKDPVPGANDGASGVAIILEIARQLSLKSPSVGIDLILWDAEDYGSYEVENTFCLGSQYWAKHKHKSDYVAMYGINLDMVGAANARFALEQNTREIADMQARKIWKIAGSLGYSNMFSYDKDPAVIDDHLYIIQSGIPMVEIIDRGAGGNFFPWWHTTGDTMDKISKETLKGVGQTVLEVIYRER